MAKSVYPFGGMKERREMAQVLGRSEFVWETWWAALFSFVMRKGYWNSHVSIRPWTLFSRKTSSMWEIETDTGGIRVTQVGRDLEGR